MQINNLILAFVLGIPVALGNMSMAFPLLMTITPHFPKDLVVLLYYLLFPSFSKKTVFFVGTFKGFRHGVID